MRIQPLFLILPVALVALVTLFSTGLVRPTEAKDASPHAVYLSITGEGATAKAWFAGAPPACLLVQDALDQFSEKGYRIAELSPSLRPQITVFADGDQLTRSQDTEHVYVILMER